MTPPPSKPKKTTKKNKLVRGATAVIGLGVMAATNFTGNKAVPSQALVQVDNQFMAERTEGAFDMAAYGDGYPPCPCDPNQHFNLDDTYLTFDVRDSYITR